MSSKRMGGSSVDANVLGVQFFDGTYQVTAAVDFPTPGSGTWFWNMYGLTFPQDGASLAIGTNNWFYINIVPYSLVVSKITIYTQPGFSGNAYVGIYDITGTHKLIDSGPIQCSAGGGAKTVSITPVAIPAGMFIVTLCADATGLSLNGTSPSANLVYIFSANKVRMGTAQNTVSGGVLPTSLGTLSYSPAAGLVNILFEAV
jgi:hypothetical protein